MTHGLFGDAQLDALLLPDEPLAKYTAARLGGRADWLYIARNTTEELATVAQTAWRNGTPMRILGGGANTLVSDHGARGLTIINRVSDIRFAPQDENNVIATSGTGLIVLAHKCAAQGFSGMEWAVSVPGTVGGAVVGNSGAHGGDMSHSVRQITLVDAEHGMQTLTLADLAFGYRTSALKTRADHRFVVLETMFALPQGDPAAIKAKMDEFVAHRKRTQPVGASLGSIFKNPTGDYAGRLIESCGLKGYQIGDAMVSPVHANFFINNGHATATDYHALIQHVCAVVLTQTGVQLQPEVEFFGEWPT
jgi:UDP-N-acetylmuramate dehydrogenase